MQFNKLYNLILQSIIIQNKAQRVAILQKCDFLLPHDKKMWIRKLDELNNNKLADFLCKYVANRQLDNVFDGRIQRVKKILQLNPSIDTQSFKGELSQFVLQYLDILKKHQQKQAAKSIKGLDSIKQFTKVKEYPNGVVIYRVQDDGDGMRAVRRIVTAQWGEDANPWCLISWDDKHTLANAWRYWNQYNTYPKHIAFQNGKLLAFSANNEITNKWWDRNDKPSNKLKLLDGSQMKTPKFQWDEEHKIKKFLAKHDETKLVYNKQTGLYDVHGNIMIQNEDLVNGHFPVKFGEVTEGFRCWYSRSLTSLEGAPKKVGTFFDVSHNPNLRSLEGAPQYVGGIFNCIECSKLTNLKGAPKYVGENFDCWGCKKLISLQGCPEEVGGGFDCGSTGITNLQFAPKKVGGNFECRTCKNLQSLKGAPRRVEKNFDCWSCQNLKSLQGGPEYVGGKFECSWCKSLTSLKGSPRIIKGGLECYNCYSLLSLQGGPDEVAWINNYDCRNLKLTEQDKQKYKISWIK